jgi:hypothetical protein
MNGPCLIFLFFFFVAWHVAGQGQIQHLKNEHRYIPDTAFVWQDYEAPITKTSAPLYKKARIDARIESHDPKAFEDLIVTILETFTFGQEDAGMLKIVFIFGVDHGVQVQKIGHQNDLLHKAQKEKLKQRLEDSLTIRPAIHQGQSVHSIGYIYIAIKNGTIVWMNRKNINLFGE